MPEYTVKDQWNDPITVTDGLGEVTLTTEQKTAALKGRTLFRLTAEQARELGTALFEAADEADPADNAEETSEAFARAAEAGLTRPDPTVVINGDVIVNVPPVSSQDGEAADTSQGS